MNPTPPILPRNKTEQWTKQILNFSSGIARPSSYYAAYTERAGGRPWKYNFIHSGKF
jgi:hypothetical protein